MSTHLASEVTPDAAVATRIAHLFRQSRRAGAVHPLLHVLQHHRNAAGVLDIAIADHPGKQEAPTGMLIDTGRLYQCIGELPALPQVVLELVSLLRDDVVHLDDCVARIESDQTLAARTLRLANSAFYGVPGRVGTIRDAVQVLGLRALSTLLTTASIAAQFSRTASTVFDFGAFWRHSIGCAIAARCIARLRRMDEDVAFTAGLLHDIGRLALAAHFPRELDAALQHARDAELAPLVAERIVTGTDHVTIGVALVTHWHLPHVVAAAIKHHHTVAEDSSHTLPPSIADVVHLANAMAHALDLSALDHESVPPVDLAAWNRVSPTRSECVGVLEQTESGVVGLCQALAL